MDPDSPRDEGGALRPTGGGGEQAHEALQSQKGPRRHEKGLKFSIFFKAVVGII